jgi:hypothetical protein
METNSSELPCVGVSIPRNCLRNRKGGRERNTGRERQQEYSKRDLEKEDGGRPAAARKGRTG